MNYNFLLSIALILLFTKLFGLATAKVHLPQVVGALVAGILLGPCCFGILHQSSFLTYTAEIGVILLMFDEDGNLRLMTEAEEDDILYDEIGSELKIRQLQLNKKELFEQLEQYYEAFF